MQHRKSETSVGLLFSMLLASACGGGGDHAPDTAAGNDAALDAAPDTGTDSGAPDTGFRLEGCDTTAPGLICAGAAKVALTPGSFETVKPEFLEDHAECADSAGPTCGSLDYDKMKTAFTEDDWSKGFFVDTNGNGKFDGYWLAGFGASRPMQAVHDDIWARAAVFRHSSVTVAVVAVDLIGFFYSDVVKIRERLAAHPEIGIDGLVVASTHSHAAVDPIGMWSMEDPFSEFYAEDENFYLGSINNGFVDEVIGKVAAAVIEAARSMKPATLVAASARVGIDNLVTDIRDPFIIDDTLSVLHATSDTGEPIATLVNWGGHAEAIDDLNNSLSSDYPHYLREALENGLPAAGEHPAHEGLGEVAIFLQGASGGMISPLDAQINDRAGNPMPGWGYEQARAAGENLAEKTYALLESAVQLDDTTVSWASKAFRPPIENKYFGLLFGSGIIRTRPLYQIEPPPGVETTVGAETEVGLIRIGPVTFQTIPGELFPELAVGGYQDPFPYSHGRPIIAPENEFPPDLSKAPQGPYLRELMPGQFRFLVTLGQDELGYMVPAYDFVLSETDPYLEEAPGEHYEETRGIGRAVVDMIGDVYVELSVK
ncbi:MAG: hypothetical protein HY897_04570 [Deltaproteobacteria bacterium]|nr:hypothetical protein [Deltaproteobacteria bacterium]